MTAKIKLNAASGGGSFSLQAPSSSSNNRVITLPDIADGTLLTNQSSGLGKVLQYKYKEVSGTVYSTSSNSFANLSDFDLTITPTSATSILVIQVNLRVSVWHSSANGGSHSTGISDDNGSTFLSFGMLYPYRYDSGGFYHEGSDIQVTSVVAGSTNARTYKLYHKIDGAQQARINQNIATSHKDRSSIQVMEITP